MNPRWFCLQGTRVQFLVQVLKESSPLCQEQTVDVSVLGSLCSSSSSLIVIPVTNVNFANPPRTLIPLYLRRPRCCRRSSSVVDVCCPWQSMPAIRFPFCGISSIIPSYWPHPRPVFRHHGLEDPSKTSSQALRRFTCLCRCFVTTSFEDLDKTSCLCWCYVTMGWKIPAKLHRKRCVAFLASAGVSSPWVWRPQQNSTPRCHLSQSPRIVVHLYRVQSTFVFCPRYRQLPAVVYACAICPRRSIGSPIRLHLFSTASFSQCLFVIVVPHQVSLLNYTGQAWRVLRNRGMKRRRFCLRGT